MTTVIRLKRRVDEDPLNAFVLNCKRQRVEAGETTDDPNANAAESSTILKFAGTFSQVWPTTQPVLCKVFHPPKRLHSRPKVSHRIYKTSTKTKRRMPFRGCTVLTSNPGTGPQPNRSHKTTDSGLLTAHDPSQMRPSQRSMAYRPRLLMSSGTMCDCRRKRCPPPSYPHHRLPLR